LAEESKLQDYASVATLVASTATVIALLLAAYQFNSAAIAERQTRNLNAALWLFQVDTALTERLQSLREAVLALPPGEIDSEQAKRAKSNLIDLDSFILSVETAASTSDILFDPWRDMKFRLCPELLREGYFARPELGQLLLTHAREICRAL
jgi:hypothetical protein